jgi:hypothetical protein
VGEVQARLWVLTTKTNKNGQQEQVEAGGVTSVKPADLKFVNRQVITVGFVPGNTQLPKPPSSTILALVQVLQGGQPVATTTTTAAGVTTTIAPSATTTSVPASTTTTKPPSTTTTTASSSSTTTK